MAAGRLADAVGHPQGERTGDLATEHVPALGDLIGDLVHGAGHEVGEVHVHHREKAGHRGAQGGAHDGGLGDRRVEHALRPELLRQPFGHAEGHAEHDVLADAVHARVASHLLAEREVERLAKIHDRHQSLQG